MLIDRVNQGIKDTYITLQENSAGAKKVGAGAHIKFLEGKLKCLRGKLNGYDASPS